MTLEYLILLITVLYVVQILIFQAVLNRSGTPSSSDHPGLVSVVVAARNEEATIARCLQSLIDQDYPSDRYEIIVVNDQSNDGTVQICSRFREQYPHVKLEHAPESTVLRGKTNALAHGIDAATGDVIFVTDADCVVPSTWISGTLDYYSSEVGIVGGMTLQNATGWFGGMQSLDWAFLLGIASATTTMGLPLSSIGNNLSFRKKAYNQVGGYRNLPFSVTEDFLLFQSIAKTKSWKYLYPITPRTLVMSEPCKSVGELIRQKRRWGKGGLRMTAYGFLVMTVGFGLHAVIAAGLMLGSIAAAGTALMAKIVSDYLFLRTVLASCGAAEHIKHFYKFEVYYICYTILLPFMVLFGGRVRWKGRTY